jgi:hypothetical protein
MRTRHWISAALFLLVLIGCHSDRAEPASAAATQGSEDPVYDTPDGTVGPNVSAPTPAAAGLGPGNGGPPDIAGGAGGIGPGPGAGIGGAGGIIEEGR